MNIQFFLNISFETNVQKFMIYVYIYVNKKSHISSVCKNYMHVTIKLILCSYKIKIFGIFSYLPCESKQIFNIIQEVRYQME